MLFIMAYKTDTEFYFHYVQAKINNRFKYHNVQCDIFCCALGRYCIISRMGVDIDFMVIGGNILTEYVILYL